MSASSTGNSPPPAPLAFPPQLSSPRSSWLTRARHHSFFSLRGYPRRLDLVVLSTTGARAWSPPSAEGDPGRTGRDSHPELPAGPARPQRARRQAETAPELASAPAATPVVPDNLAGRYRIHVPGSVGGWHCPDGAMRRVGLCAACRMGVLALTGSGVDAPRVA